MLPLNAHKFAAVHLQVAEKVVAAMIDERIVKAVPESGCGRCIHVLPQYVLLSWREQAKPGRIIVPGAIRHYRIRRPEAEPAPVLGSDDAVLHPYCLHALDPLRDVELVWEKRARVGERPVIMMIHRNVRTSA